MKRKFVGTTEAARAARRIKRANDVASWTDESSADPLASTTTDTAGGQITIAQLPLSLLHDGIFSFLAPPPSLAQPTTMRHGINTRQYKAQLGALRAVCKRWSRVTQQSLASCEAQVHKIRFQTADETDRARIIHDAQAHGDHVRALAIVTGTYSDIMWSFITATHFCKDELVAATAWWRELLACFPHLERLDLKGVELCYLENVLQAASEACPRVQGLVFLDGSPVMGHRPDQAEITTLNHALSDALSKWHKANGGLRLLTAPCWARYNDAAHANVLKAVAAFCPEIEYLKTWDYAGITRSNQATPHNVPVSVWREFCQRCTKLREFSWNLCELTAKHAQLFVETAKPQLESLVIEQGIEDWKNHTTFALIESVLASVPTVRTLTLAFQDAADPYEEDDEEEADGEETLAALEARCAGLDAMVASIALHCPKLEKFECKFIYDDGYLAISESAIKSVARLSSLRELHVDRCRLHTDAIDQIRSRTDDSDSSARVEKVDSTEIPHTAIYSVVVYFTEQPASAETVRERKVTKDVGEQEENKAKAKEEEEEEPGKLPPIRRSSRRSGRS